MYKTLTTVTSSQCNFSYHVCDRCLWHSICSHLFNIM